jgi:VWFA-related protein
MSSCTAHSRLSIIALALAAVFLATMSATAQEFPAAAKTHAVSSVMDDPSLILQPDQTISQGSTVALCAYVLGGMPPYSYLWHAESFVGGSLMIDSTSQYVVAKPEGNTVFRCTVTDALNRKIEGAAAVSVLPTTASSISIRTARAVQGQRILDFRVLCGDQFKTPVYEFTRDNLVVTENGVQITDFSLSSKFWNPLSAALVVDCSGSMTGSPIAAAKSAAQSFVGNMDGIADEAALFGFSTTVTLLQSMTSNKVMLNSTINALGGGGSTALWDAVYAAIQHLAVNATNPNKVVVLLSDGGDNSSTHNVNDVILAAQADSVRLYPIGLGSLCSRDLLDTCAKLTGGVYMEAPTPAQLDSVFGMMFSIARTTNGPCCRVLFNSSQPGNPTTTVGISTLNLCNGIPASASVDITTGVDQVPVNPQVALSPNPSNGAFALSMYVHVPTRVQVRVIDALGRSVYSQEQQALPGQYNTSIVLPNAVPGMYMLHVSGNGLNKVKKLVVK